MSDDTNLNVCECGHLLAEHIPTAAHERGKCETAGACACEAFVPKHPPQDPEEDGK